MWNRRLPLTVIVTRYRSTILCVLLPRPSVMLHYLRDVRERSLRRTSLEGIIILRSTVKTVFHGLAACMTSGLLPCWRACWSVSRESFSPSVCGMLLLPSLLFFFFLPSPEVARVSVSALHTLKFKFSKNKHTFLEIRPRNKKYILWSKTSELFLV